jgi:hypothetical protein
VFVLIGTVLTVIPDKYYIRHMYNVYTFRISVKITILINFITTDEQIDTLYSSQIEVTLDG